MPRLPGSGGYFGALDILKAERDKLSYVIDLLSGTGVGATGLSVVPVPHPQIRSRVHTVASRAKIAAAQRARWAKVRGKARAAKKKFSMSPAAKAKISKAMKARWAKIRADK